mmetsp:Transcript_14036/g.28108  ORF Transcript_14036/g.28108 Transcript_14036/m.28108 type:complete len:87 (-) Transcript_14036:739-999(-)
MNGFCRQALLFSSSLRSISQSNENIQNKEGRQTAQTDEWRRQEESVNKMKERAADRPTMQGVCVPSTTLPPLRLSLDKRTRAKEDA